MVLRNISSVKGKAYFVVASIMQKGFSILKAEDACVDFEGQGMISPFEEVSAPPLPPKIDDRLAKATLQVLETGRLTPLIKEELKCKIQARRHSLGQEEYNVEFKKPKSYLLTPEEEQRATHRKERNRLAAQRFRRKRKVESSSLEVEVDRLTNANAKLQAEFDSLTVEKEQLLFALSQIRTPSGPILPGVSR
ncbi:cyclic AMP-dependent transcription factor ATF-3-like isoform X1 [Haliotis rufescens]|uniref:cyclic AMP-dependent transcription factor ATF-3-like isoform X1 n=2 Tax=Haliotis rufescens TaxID=6454 RepID=UPI001EAF9A14|nr:cyclic AMP-dependent transcription factor ATF-3-like isoform X1 [Haliotis rufescens]